MIYKYNYGAKIMLWTIRGLARNTIWFGATHQGQWRSIVECLRGKEDLNSRPVRRVLDAQNLDLNLVHVNTDAALGAALLKGADLTGKSAQPLSFVSTRRRGTPGILAICRDALSLPPAPPSRAPGRQAG
mgnify:CR=1 FL=1